jgi:RNA polymerase sigma factor (sigma-70 family)
MAASSLKNVVRNLRSLAASELSDSELLQHFVASADEGAFTALLRRHGRVVLGVCNRVLGAGPDAEDVFQATFVVLARKADSISKQESVASWLHGVAYRMAYRLRSQRALRRNLERAAEQCLEQIAEDPSMAVDPCARASLRELSDILDDELRRLPAGCRDTLVMCLLKGRSNSEAARRLGLPLGTVKDRLQRGRELLRQRLQRRGVSLSAVALSVVLSERAAAVPVKLKKAVLACVLRRAVPARVAALTTKVTGVGVLAKLAAVAVLGVMLAGLAMGAIGVEQRDFDDPPRTEPDAEARQLEQPRAGVDGSGDPLPNGAVARLGTTRWRHGGLSKFVFFLPDGQSVLSVGEDNVCHVWEYPSGKELRRFGLEETDEPASSKPDFTILRELEVAMSRDGKTVACYFDGRGLHLFDIATGKQVPAPEEFETLGVGGVEFLPDNTLVTLEFDGMVTVWDWVHGKKLHSFNSHGTGKAVYGRSPILVCSQDGKKLLTLELERVGNTIERVMKLWETASGKELGTIPRTPKTAFRPPVFSPDGKLLAIIDLDSCISLVDTSTLKARSEIHTGGRFMRTPVFRQDGKSLLTRETGTTIKEWDIATGKQIRSFAPKLSTPRLNSTKMTFSPDYNTLAVCGQDHALHFFDLATGEERNASADPNVDIQMVRFTPDGKKLWIQDIHGIRQWAHATDNELRLLELGGRTNQHKLSPDGQYVAIRSLESDTRLIDVATGEERGSIPLRDGATAVATGFSADGKLLATRRFKELKVEIYDVPSLNPRHTFSVSVDYDKMTLDQALNTPFGTVPQMVVFSPNGQIFGACIDPKALTLFDVATGKKLTSLLPPVGLQFHNGTFTPDGRCLALDFDDGTVGLYELATGKQRRTFGVKAPQPKPRAADIQHVSPRRVLDAKSKLAFSPDGRRLAHAGLDRQIHVWDMLTGKEATFQGHTGSINSIAFSPDGARLASGSNDTTSLVWDFAKVASPTLAVHALSNTELERCWLALLDKNAARAFDAMVDLIASPARTSAYLAERLSPAPKIDTHNAEQMIAALGSPTFKVRQDATSELLKGDARFLPLIDKALAAQPPLEVKTRLDEVRNKITSAELTEEHLRLVRAMEVLEWIGSPEARRTLKSLSDGALGAFSTVEAQAALQRLEQR